MYKLKKEVKTTKLRCILKVPAYLESLCKLVCMEIRKHMCACEREITTEDTVLSFPWLDGRSI